MSPSQPSVNSSFPACELNIHAWEQLWRDAPDKRRRLYLEWQSQSMDDLMAALCGAGLDVDSLRCIQPITDTACSVITGISCLVTGSAQAILNLLTQSTHVRLVSIDLPEFSWLSAAHEPLQHGIINTTNDSA